MSPKARAHRYISETFIRAVSARMAANLPVRRTLPDQGRLHVDRQLPILCVYRRPTDRDDPGTDQLVAGEASYLVAPGSKPHQKSLSALVRGIVETLGGQFGAFLVVELWAGKENESSDAGVPSVRPEFSILVARDAGLSRVTDVLAQRLRKIEVLKQGVEVKVVFSKECWPQGMRPLLTREEAAALKCSRVGLVVPPVYRDAKTGQDLPLLLRSLRRKVGRALRQMFYEFARSHTSHRPPHYHELGRRAVVKSVWEVDRRLTEVSNSFDFLLQVTPINSDDAWREFRRLNFDRAPRFHYRPTPYDPGLLKRDLYRIPVDRVEDPALEHVFREKQEELDRKISLLSDRDTPRFLYGGLQLYGPVEDSLLRLAQDILEKVPSRGGDEPSKGQLDAKAFAAQAEAEFEYYRKTCSDFSARARVTDKVSGVMVSRGELLINPSTKVSGSRVNALLQHEVGTHLVTYYNGRTQPFSLLSSGLAGYDAFQEGLAVLAEHLVGGLSRLRLRQLAARVVATQQMIDGASFVETFRALVGDHGFAQRSAFTIAMRIYRGGGLVKDAVYLRGLVQVMAYLRKGGRLDVLFVGKMAAAQIAIIRELLFRKVLQPAPLSPRFMNGPLASQRLARIASGEVSLLELAETRGSSEESRPRKARR